jgi:hypothetical protein
VPDQWADRTHVWRKMLRADIRMIKVPNWKTVVEDSTKWKGVVEKTKTLRDL